jgi:glycine betaine/choline ABC-type transport system substrate-binding protein
MTRNLLVQSSVTKPSVVVKNIVSKRFAGLVSIGMLFLPIMVTSAYGSTNISTNSKIPNSSSILTFIIDELLEQTLANCNYNDNLQVIATNFISKCCKASIRQVFPGEYLNETLLYIEQAQSIDARAKTAYKLLNDGRFRK